MEFGKKRLLKGNWVVYWIGWLLAAVFLIFLARVTSLRFAILIGALLVFLVFVAIEVISRRQWEKRLLYKLDQQDKEYLRLVREIARNRNELSQLKEGLAETGRIATQASQGHRLLSVEQRMLSNIAERLTIIGSMDRPEGDQDTLLKDMEFEDLEHDVTQELLKEKTPTSQDEKALTIDAPQVKDLSMDAVEDLSVDSDESIMRLLQKAVDDDRIDVFAQPIVNLPQRKWRFSELLSRIRVKADAYLPAKQYIHLALKDDLLPAIDNLLLLRALQLVRDINLAEDGVRAYFCNISPLTLSDSKFMGDLVEFISQNRHLAPRLIFELSQDNLQDSQVMTDDVRAILNGLAEMGCHFSMDSVTNLDIDLGVLEDRHIHYIKVDATVMLENIKDSGSFSRMKRLKAELDRKRIDLIITHIEQEKDLVELLDLDIDYGQGYLFGEPEISKNF